MRRNHLKIVMLGWGLLIISVVWSDRWQMIMAYGFVACLLGAVVLTSNSSSEERDRREAKRVGILLIGSGVLMTLIEAYDRSVFIIR
jgi:hypothetical protein